MTLISAQNERYRRHDRGKMSYHFGQAAEGQVERFYVHKGARVLHRRWRGRVGEIDLVLQDVSGLIFVEVKASKSMDHALRSLRPAQIQRIMQTAEEFLAQVPTGSLTNVRFDVACVDGSAQTQVLENAFGHF
jgi:putative endonuclease